MTKKDTKMQIIEDNQNIEEYTKMIFPMIEHNAKRKNPQYVYNHAYYEYSQYFKRLISQKILDLYEKEKKSEENINDYIKRNLGLKGRFILEHIWSGGMFREAMKKLYKENKLTISEIVKLVSVEYAMGYMTKEESTINNKGKKVSKSIRSDIDIKYLKSLLSTRISDIS